MLHIKTSLANARIRLVNDHLGRAACGASTAGERFSDGILVSDYQGDLQLGSQLIRPDSAITQLSCQTFPAALEKVYVTSKGKLIIQTAAACNLDTK